MKRREFIKLIGGAATINAALARRTRAESTTKRVIAMLFFYGPSEIGLSFVSKFPQGLHELGYVLGRDLELVRCTAGGERARWPAVLEEVVQLKPDIIFAGATLETVAVKKATSTIPIVCPALADAVRLGLIASEARPGGNVTGIEPYVPGMPAKLIDLAREIVPGASTVGLLTNSDDPKGPPQVLDLKAAAQALGLNVVTANANRPEEVRDALRALAFSKAEVVIVLQTNLLVLSGREIGAAAIALQLPTVCGYREHVIAGALISYGVDLRWCYHRAAYFVDKILRGNAPGDLPIEFPTQFPLTVNIKTAKELGLTIPSTVLARADEVIE